MKGNEMKGKPLNQCQWCGEQLMKYYSRPALCYDCFRYASDQDQQYYIKAITAEMKYRIDDWDEYEKNNPKQKGKRQ